MSAIWTAGQAWPAELPTEIDETGLTIVTHRGTIHRLFREPGRHIVWTKANRGGPEWRPIVPVITIGTITPCGFSLRGMGQNDWHASSRAIGIYTGTEDVPDDDELDRLIAIGTGPIAGHPPDVVCQAVYCDMVPDTVEARRDHLHDLFQQIVQRRRPGQ